MTAYWLFMIVVAIWFRPRSSHVGIEQELRRIREELQKISGSSKL